VDDDVVAAVSGHQLDVGDLGRVVEVVVDLDAVLGLEALQCVGAHVVRPVVDVDDTLVAGR